MWVIAVALSTVVLAAACAVVFFGVRLRRGMRKVRFDISRLSDSQSEMLERLRWLRGEASTAYTLQLCTFLPDMCDAAIKEVTERLVYFRMVESRASENELDLLSHDCPRPLSTGYAVPVKRLPSQVLAERLEALRAIKKTYHADSGGSSVHDGPAVNRGVIPPTEDAR